MDWSEKWCSTESHFRHLRFLSIVDATMSACRPQRVHHATNTKVKACPNNDNVVLGLNLIYLTLISISDATILAYHSRCVHHTTIATGKNQATTNDIDISWTFIHSAFPSKFLPDELCLSSSACTHTAPNQRHRPIQDFQCFIHQTLPSTPLQTISPPACTVYLGTHLSTNFTRHNVSNHQTSLTSSPSNT
jgi:hypothetical protein